MNYPVIESKQCVSIRQYSNGLYLVTTPGKSGGSLHQSLENARKEVGQILSEGWYEYHFEREVHGKTCVIEVTPVGIRLYSGPSPYYFSAFGPVSAGNLEDSKTFVWYQDSSMSRVTKLRVAAAMFRNLSMGLAAGRVCGWNSRKEWLYTRKLLKCA